MGILREMEIFARRMTVKRRMIIYFTVIIMAVTGLMGIYATHAMREHVFKLAQDKLMSDLALGSRMLETYFPGEWSIRDDLLYKGPSMLEGQNIVIDEIAEATGDKVTLFKGNVRVATNVMIDGKRQVGTTVSQGVEEQVLKKGQIYIGQADVVGTPYLTAYEPIKNTEGEIIGIWYVGVPATPYNDLVKDFRVKMIIFSFLFIACGVLISLFVGYTVWAPLGRIRDGVEKVSEGDLTVAIPQLAWDEIGQLSAGVNSMREKIAGLIRQAGELCASVSESSSQVLGISTNSTRMMTQMSAQTSEMSHNADAQTQATEQARFTIGEMTRAMQQLALNAEQVSSSALLASNRANEGERQLASVMEQFDTIHNTVNGTAQVVQDLGDKSEEIGAIVEIITSIADQTNLLALNAAIEAARAGEQGRGFAVVADEVRKLAEESSDAAKRIAMLIQQIQHEAGRAVTAMTGGTREVAAGLAVIEGTGQFFQNIMAAIKVVNEQIQEMSAASQQISASAEATLQSIDRTAIMAEQNQQAASQISQFAEEQMSGSEEINAALTTLNQLVSELEAAMRQFKVG